MQCPFCKSEDIKIRVDIDDAGDVEETVCAEDACGYILKRERIIEQLDGTKVHRPQRVSAEEQPEGLVSKKGRGPMSVEEEIPSAADMARVAEQMREETIGRAARDLVRAFLKEVATPDIVLKGEHSFVIPEDDDVPAVVIEEVIKELRARGYKPARNPEPGVGTWIQIKWPTQVAKKRKKRKADSTPETEELVFKKKNEGDEEIKRKARLAKNHRKKALSARSELPK